VTNGHRPTLTQPFASAPLQVKRLPITNELRLEEDDAGHLMLVLVPHAAMPFTVDDALKLVNALQQWIAAKQHGGPAPDPPRIIMP
jgi:hypothetical protein